MHSYILNLQGKRNVGIEIIQSITRYSETFSYQERNYERFVNVLLTGGADGFGGKPATIAFNNAVRSYERYYSRNKMKV